MKLVEQKQLDLRLYTFGVFVLCFSLAILFKLIDIQYIKGNYYRSKVQNRVFKTFDIPANRGNLYDCNMNLLATSITKYDIHFDPLTVSDQLFNTHLQDLCRGLSKIFDKPQSYYNHKFTIARKAKNRYVVVALNISYSQYQKVVSLPIFNKGANQGGVITAQHTVRYLPLGDLAKRSIGYERIDSKTGKLKLVGLEGAYSTFLKGKIGKRKKQKIAKNQWKPIGDVNEVEPQDGLDVVSTIDINIQDIAHKALEEQLKLYDADHGSIVVMETNTAAVRAISNLSRTSKGNYSEVYNYAVGEAHEPGSTFKLMVLMAALEDKVIDSSTVVNTDRGTAKFYDRVVRDSRYGGYGEISMARAFEVSSNTAFAKIVNQHYGNRPKDFVNRLIQMGLDKPLGLPIKGEGKPHFPYPGDRNWYGTTLPWMSHGYGISITPLQTLAFYNAIANNGQFIKPRFIEQVRYWDQVHTQYTKDQIVHSICTEKNAQVAQTIMRNVVLRGTAKNLQHPDLKIAGKTGTCWGNYTKSTEDRKYIASFVGYFPADNPRYSCIVVIHDPDKEKGYYGSLVAGPVFKQVALNIYNNTPVNYYIDDIDKVWKVKQATDYYDYYNYLKNTDTVPDVIGMPAMDAIALLENLGLSVVVKGKGNVVKQSIAPKTPYIADDIIYLDLDL